MLWLLEGPASCWGRGVGLLISLGFRSFYLSSKAPKYLLGIVATNYFTILLALWDCRARRQSSAAPRCPGRSYRNVPRAPSEKLNNRLALTGVLCAKEMLLLFFQVIALKADCCKEKYPLLLSFARFVWSEASAEFNESQKSWEETWCNLLKEPCPCNSLSIKCTSVPSF